MKPTSKNSLGFVINAFAIALIALAMLHEFAPTKQKIAVDNAMIDAATAELKLISGDDLLALLKEPKPTLLFGYASWCGYCKETLPELLQLMEQGKLADRRVIILSVDKSPRALAKYLAEEGYSGKFTPYLLEVNKNPQAFSELLTTLGSRYRGGIPYIAAIDAGGELQRDAIGRLPAADIQAMVSR